MNLIQSLRISLRSSMVLRWLSLTPESNGEQVALIYNGAALQQAHEGWSSR